MKGTRNNAVENVVVGNANVSLALDAVELEPVFSSENWEHG